MEERSARMRDDRTYYLHSLECHSFPFSLEPYALMFELYPLYPVHPANPVNPVNPVIKKIKIESIQ